MALLFVFAVAAFLGKLFFTQAGISGFMANYPYITYFLKEQLDEYIHQGPVGHRSVPAG